MNTNYSDSRRELAKELWLLELRLESFAYLFRGYNGEPTRDTGPLIGMADIFDEMRARMVQIRTGLESLDDNP